MENLDLNQTRAIRKKFIKTMPIWQHVDELQAELVRLDIDIKSYLKGLEERCDRISKLPNLNITGEQLRKPCPDDSENQDVVLYYSKNGDQYERLTEVDRELIHKIDPDKANTRGDWNCDESIKMLELKIKADEIVFAAQRPGKPWIKCKVMMVSRRPNDRDREKPLIIFKLKQISEVDAPPFIVDKFKIARAQDHGDFLQPPKRVIAGDSQENMFPGTIGFEPSEENGDRYLVLMDDGSAGYFHTNQIFPIMYQSAFPWVDVRQTGVGDSRIEAYIRYFLSTYPRRDLLRASIGIKLDVDRAGTFIPAQIVDQDCDIMTFRFNDGLEEKIYRGSPRLNKRTNIFANQLRSQRQTDSFFPKIVLNMHRYHTACRRALDEEIFDMTGLKRAITLSVGHNTARKSTTTKQRNTPNFVMKINDKYFDGHRNISELSDWDQDKYDRQRVHRCDPRCLDIDGVKTENNVNDIVGEFMDVSDLRVPLVLGWKREIFKTALGGRGGRTKVLVFYEAPCGKMFHQLIQIRRYLSAVNSKMDLDYFSIDPKLELYEEIDDLKAYYRKTNIAIEPPNKPLENKNIGCVNLYNQERLQDDFTYWSRSSPHKELERNGFSFNEEFKSGCDCVDDCFQRASCPCHKLNEDAAGRIKYNRGMVDKSCQYFHKRLESQIPTGIFECNSFCKCSSKCGNRVVQNGIRFRLSVFKTLDKGWGVKTLDAIPCGAFICTYAAEILDDADQYGTSDMYYADLDYISVNETQKELDESDEGNSDEGVDVDDDDDDDSDFQVSDPKSRGAPPRIYESEEDSDVDVVSDKCSRSKLNKNGASSSRTVDRESRQPKRKVTIKPPKPAKKKNAGAASKEKRVPFRSIHDVLGSHDFTLDARMCGNVGRFLNHSCDPNSFVQNIFIESHDLRFPVPAFFASRRIKALEEITWNYNYKMGSIAGRVIICKCGSSNCRGRIL